MTDLLTVAEVAALMRRQSRSVRALIRAGALEAVRDGRRWLVAREWVTDYYERRRRRPVLARMRLGAGR